MSAQLDKRHGREGAFGGHLQRTCAQVIQVAHDNQQVWGCLHRQKTTTWHIHTCKERQWLTHVPSEKVKCSINNPWLVNDVSYPLNSLGTQINYINVEPSITQENMILILIKKAMNAYHYVIHLLKVWTHKQTNTMWAKSTTAQAMSISECSHTDTESASFYIPAFLFRVSLLHDVYTVLTEVLDMWATQSCRVFIL